MQIYSSKNKIVDAQLDYNPLHLLKTIAANANSVYWDIQFPGFLFSLYICIEMKAFGEFELEAILTEVVYLVLFCLQATNHGSSNLDHTCIGFSV